MRVETGPEELAGLDLSWGRRIDYKVAHHEELILAAGVSDCEEALFVYVERIFGMGRGSSRALDASRSRMVVHRRGDLVMAKRESVILVIAGCMVLLALIMAAHSQVRLANEERAAGELLQVTRVPKAGGSVAIAETGGRTLILSAGGVVSISDGRARLECAIPRGFWFSPQGVIGDKVLLAQDGGLRNTIGLWDLSVPDEAPESIVADHEITGFMAVDLLGAEYPELVLVTCEKWRNLGSPRDNHERVEVWSLEGEEPTRLYLGDFVAEGRVSNIGHVYAVDVGLGDARPELVWRQVDAAWDFDGDTRLVLVSPTQGFRAHESERLGPLHNIEGFAFEEDAVTAVLLPFGQDSQIAMELPGGSFRRTDREIDAADLEVLPHTTMSGGGSSVPADHREGVVLDRPYSSSVEVSLPDGESFVLRARSPITGIHSAGLADLDGDGVNELVVTAGGEPVICGCSRTGYVGWAKRTEDGSFGDLQWSDPLGGPLVGLDVGDVDGRPGEEIVAGVLDTHCSNAPSGLWIFSP